jgi:GrpB-like predicted nucleotidyltransferase (UPF0157 family)
LEITNTIQKFETFGLGLIRRGHVVVLPHDPRWGDAFSFESNRLEFNVHPNFCFHHIGSTSIPGISAKPILDILLEAPHISLLDQKQMDFESLGYEVKGEFGIPGRRYYVLANPDKTKGYVHVHAYEKNHPEIARHLLFRDYLRQHREVAAKYQELKESILKNSEISREGYTEAKNPFISEILKLASS